MRAAQLVEVSMLAIGLRGFDFPDLAINNDAVQG